MVIAPLFGIAQTVYFFGIAERLMGIQKEFPVTSQPQHTLLLREDPTRTNGETIDAVNMATQEKLK